MKRVDIVIVAYSLLLFVGGLIGYFVAGSVASLLMGAIFAILLSGSLFLSRSYPAMAFRSQCVLLVALFGFFGYRWYSAAKFVPAGLSCLLSVVVLAALLLDRSRRRV